MKYKHKRVCKSLISLLLILAFVLAPFESVFAGPPYGVNGEASTGDPGGVQSGLGSSTPKPLKGLAVTIAILEIDNTASEYRSQIAAHNLASPDDYWSEYRVSVIDQFLYSHPEKMSQVAEMENQAIILLGQKADYNDGEDSKYRPIDEMGVHKNDGKYSRVYSASGKSSPGNFNIDVVYSSIKNNEVLYKSFTGGKLTFDDVNQLGVASGKVSEATDKFVRLWANAGTVDDCLNGIFDGLDQNSDTYWYDCALRYLDFLYVIDVLCGNKYDKLIGRYLEQLNRDESDTFITVCAAVNAVMNLGDGRFYVATLPNYYAATGNGSFSDYQTFSVTGNFVDAINPENYSGSIDSFVHTLQGKYDSNYPVGGGDYGSKLSGDNRKIWWWTDSYPGFGGYMGARVCQPTDINGNTTGNTGYTFLGVPGKEKAPPPYDEKYENEDDPDDEPDKEDARLKFYISATSDQYEVMKGDTVAAIIDINFKQNEQAIRDFRLLWTANAAKTGDDTPLIGIAIDLDSANEPGNNVVDAVVNNPAHKGEFKTTTTGALLTMRDVDWETALKMFYGREKFTFQDSNITVNEAKERVYRATIGIYWMYPDDSNENILVYGVGKFKDSYADYNAYDKVPWTPREDPPNQGHFYSQIRDGNYVEMKDNSPGSGETYCKELKELGNMLDIISIHSYPPRTEKTIGKALGIKLSILTQKILYIRTGKGYNEITD